MATAITRLREPRPTIQPDEPGQVAIVRLLSFSLSLGLVLQQRKHQQSSCIACDVVQHADHPLLNATRKGLRATN